jgi:hypothetical protein
MDHHRRLLRQRGDLVERELQRAVRVGIGLGLEADMAVADLDETEAARRRRQGGAAEVDRSPLPWLVLARETGDLRDLFVTAKTFFSEE